jgi:DNA-binding transcriptional MerR regulator
MRYRMKTVSDLTGIPRNTLVAWERRYGIPEPERLSNGYRLYSDRDIGVLIKLRDAIAKGLAISEAVEMVREGAEPATAPAAASASSAGMPQIGADLLEALLAFDRVHADRLMERLLHLPFLAAIDDVYFPLLRRVGDMWQAGEASVAQEHFVTVFVRDQLVAMLLRVGVGRTQGPRVACVTFPGEKHELALLALAVHLSLRGCRVTYLGADLPAPELSTFVQQTRPDWLCVSVIVPVEVKTLASFARAVKRAGGEGTTVVIGGAGLPELGRTKLPPGVELVADWRALEIN